jgi:putative tricarboxylic transport membrane protein
MLKRYRYPVIATVIGLLLARTAEAELIRTWQLGGGSFWHVLERPIASTFLLFTLVTVGWGLLRSFQSRKANSDT